MKNEVKKEILFDLQRTIDILGKKELKDKEELRILSNHAVEDVALHKDLDLISVTVLIYSIYKVLDCISPEDYDAMVSNLQDAHKHLSALNFGRYNKSVKHMYKIVRGCNAKVKLHFQDVMHAAKIKKGAILLGKGLSIGQAAGLMGLSNWDLQQYAGKTVTFDDGFDKVPAKKRLIDALNIFNIK